MYEFLERFNDDEEQMRFGEDMRKYTVYAILVYIFPILFFLPILVDSNSDFCKFHANQGLCWMIIFFAVEIITGILGGISPVLGLFGGLINILTLAVMVILVLGASKGMAIKIPVLGDMIKPFK